MSNFVGQHVRIVLNKKLNTKASEIFWAYFFIVPMFVFYFVFFIYPAISGIILSFFEYGLTDMTYVGLDNYREIFSNDVFRRSITNTLAFAVIIVPVSIILSLYMSTLIFQKSMHLQSFLKGAFYLPTVITMVSITLVWKSLYNYAYGSINYFFGLIGIEPINWLGNYKIVIISICLVITTAALGQPIILYIAAMAGIPSTFYEASKIDGANQWQQFWNITIPLLTPTTLFIMITRTIGIFQLFDIVYLLTGGGPSQASTTVMMQLYQSAFVFGKFGSSAAMGVILFVLIMLFAIFQFRIFMHNTEY